MPVAKRRLIATQLINKLKLSERRACYLSNLSRSVYRFKPKPKLDNRLRSRLKELASQYPRYGYLMLHSLLKSEGLVKNKKRTYRLYREEKLQVRTKKRGKIHRQRVPLLLASSVNERWSMNFVSDQLASHRRFRVLNVIDDFSRELIGQLVSISISGQQVARFLNQLIEVRSKPQSITCDNGSEFTSKAMFFWAKELNIKLSFIQPGKPIQNAFVESLNGKFRNECLNQHWFRSLAEARYEINKWREHYNHVRPHSSLNYLTPIEYAKRVA